MPSEKSKLIRVSEDTYQKLTQLGSKQDTYDTIVKRLIESTPGTQFRGASKPKKPE